MRILQVCQRPQRRGAEIFANQLSGELRIQGHEVITAYLYPHEGEAALPLAAHDVVLDANEHHSLETLIGAQPALLRKLHRMVDRFQPDITQVNGARTIKYGVLVHSLFRASSGAVVYRNIGASPDWVRGVRRKLFYRLILRGVDGLVAISRESLDVLQHVLRPGTLSTIISNGIDPGALRPSISRPELRESVGAPSDAPVLVSVGSLTPEKRVDRLVDAFAEVRKSVPRLRLWIVGDGPLRADLESRARGLDVEDAVRFFGVREDVASFLAAADALALTSDTEGVPAVILEAGLLGLPVVATRVGGIPDCVVDGETGLLVDPLDRIELTTALRRIAQDPDLRARLGERAHGLVSAHHTMESIADQYLGFYDRVRAGARTIPLQSSSGVPANG